jgi:hypothetical protein
MVAAMVGRQPVVVAQVSRSSLGGQPVPTMRSSARSSSADAEILVDSSVPIVSRATSS